MPDKEKKSEGKHAEHAKKAKEKPEAQDSSFTHRVRVAGVILDGNKEITQALTNIKGVGRRLSQVVLYNMGIKKGTKLGTLTEQEIEKIESLLSSMSKKAPSWMLNKKKDCDSGENLHFIGPELDMSVREDLTKQKKMRSYKGIRHSLGLPVRGQRTRSSFRHGPTLGVSRKKAAPAAAKDKK